MASLIYNNFLEELLKANIDFENDTFKLALVTSSYTPDRDTHDNFDDITNEVSGTGYTAGGAALANLTVTRQYKWQSCFWCIWCYVGKFNDYCESRYFI